MNDRQTESPSTWHSLLKRGLGAIPEPDQRAILFAARIIKRKPQYAAEIADRIVTEGLLKSDVPSSLLLDAMVMSLIAGHWQEKHAEETVRQCYRQEKRLTALCLNGLSTRDPDPSEDNLPLPEYSKERPLTLGERRSLARKPDRRLIQLAMGDPNPMVMSSLLENPQVTENDIVSVASRRPASSQILSAIALHRRFRHSRRLAGALLNNPAVPIRIGFSLLPKLDVPYLRELQKNPALHTLLREATAEILRLKSSKKET